ncbi:MAG: lactonase family protein [Gemmatimonadota bacterium]|nr:lactonase family protein [Gemmatimonadota bacterium]
MPDQHLILVTSCTSGENAGITAFVLDTESGTLEQINRYTDIDSPFYLALSPDHSRLYSTHEGDAPSVVSFDIDRSSGALSKINEQATDGTTPCYLDVDRTGKVLVFANYSSGNVGSFPIQNDGSLGAMASFVQHKGASKVNTDRQMGPHAHCSVISPSGRHMFACDLGLDQVIGYSLDAASAQLTPLEQPYVRTIGGAGPRHFTYHPHGGYVYANNELANSVNVYNYDEDSGTLIEQQVISTLPGDFKELSYTADIKITPNGRHLYCSNRLHDSIAIYSIGGNGSLTLVDIQPSLGNFAQNIAITPDGKLLICANMQHSGDGESGENLVVFRIDESSGELRPAGDPTPIANPSCTMII